MIRLFNWLFQTIERKERVIDNTGANYPDNYITNKINNRKYNVISFLPIFLFNEYKYFLNLYILLLCLIQIYPPLRVGAFIIYVIPLAIITAISFTKEIWDEVKVAIKDRSYNNQVYR